MAPQQSRLNYARHKCLIEQVIPRLMVQIHQWLYEGGSLKDYLESRNILKTYFEKPERDSIKNGVDINKLDTKLLYKILRYTCNLNTINEAWHKKIEDGEKPTLEKVLYKLKKDYRNRSSHSDPTAMLNISDEELDKTVAELKHWFSLALDLAGNKAKITDKDINATKEKFLTALQEERDAESSFTPTQFIEKSHSEIAKQIEDMEILSEDRYLEPRLQITEEGPLAGVLKDQEIPCKDLFAYSCHDNSKPKLFLLVGESGAGKTSFSEHVTRTWLHRPELMATLGSFQLVLLLQCIKICTRDLSYYIREKLLPQTTKLCNDAREVTSLLNKTKVLWIVDGWDEASVEAKHLVKDLLSTLSEQHSVLATSRPEMSYELQKYSHQSMKWIKLSFTELNPSEREELVKKNLPKEKNISVTVIGYILSSKDINTPLQLVLVTKLVMDNKGISNTEKPVTLIQLYNALCQQNTKKLIEKYSKDVPSEIAEDIVANFFKRVCKVAFDNINSGSILKVSQENKRFLKKTCNNRVTPSHAFSTFFNYDEKSDTSHTEYYFPHVSQCMFYAAHHIKHIYLEANDIDSKLNKVFPHVATHKSISIYSHVTDSISGVKVLLMILLSRITFGLFPSRTFDHGFLQEMKGVIRKVCNLKTKSHPQKMELQKNQNNYYPLILSFLEMIYDSSFNDNISESNVVKVICHAIGDNSEPNRWFKVLQCSNFNADLVKAVSSKIDLDTWHVTSKELKAAHELLQYVKPNEITINILGKTKDLPHLLNVLQTVAESSCIVNLHFHLEYQRLGREFSCDDLLEIICKSSSKCKLLSYMGHVGSEGMNHLIKSTQMKTLKIRISKEKTYKILAENVHKFINLKTLFLAYDLRKYSDPESSLDNWRLCRMFRSKIDITFIIPYLQEASIKDIKKATSMLSKLTKHYHTLYVRDMSYKNVNAFVSDLSDKRVNVANFIKFGSSTNTGLMNLYHLGKLPLQYPINHFVKIWRGEKHITQLGPVNFVSRRS
ncbi:hypothetical protein Pmani_036729 [Petrolisthes manimaculis]|uniref:NACHT domain-containing protein n=1 Tax=Petrolisthes manimaculis TaxID=1843537 RepID=A0AAE1TP32_9EUCA|nr:hypothetical protein Pmani_036729 [Petrolisthes manimaculis]